MSKLFRQLNFTGGLNTYDDKTRINNNQLQTAFNVEILKDGSIEKRKGYVLKTDFGDTFNWLPLLPAGTIIKIIKYKGFWFFFYSDGIVVSNYRKNVLIDKIVNGLSLINPRSNYRYGWLYEIHKNVPNRGDIFCYYSIIYDNENDADIESYQLGYGKLHIITIDEEDVRNIVPGDILWIGDSLNTPFNDFNVYMPDGNNIDFWPDTNGNTYWDADLKNIAYMHSLHSFQNINLKANIKFNNDYLLSDGQKLYKLSDTKYEPDTNNKAFSIVNDTFIVLKRDTGEILGKVKIETKKSINFTYDQYENKIYILCLAEKTETIISAKLQIIDLTTLIVVQEKDYEINVKIAPLEHGIKVCDVKVDKNNIWFLRYEHGGEIWGKVISRINKQTLIIEDKFWGWGGGEDTEIQSIEVDYWGNRIFIGYTTNLHENIVGIIFEKNKTGEIENIYSQKIGEIKKTHPHGRYMCLCNIFIYKDYMFGDIEDRDVTPNQKTISAFKRVSGSNDYTFISDINLRNLVDCALYDKQKGDLQYQYMALLYIENNNLKYTLFSFGEEIFDGIFNLFDGLKNGLLKTSKDSIFKIKNIYIDDIDRPVNIFAHADTSNGGLTGIYSYKIKYRTKSGLESIESYEVSEVSADDNPIIIEDIYLPSYMDAVLIYRKKNGESDWTFIGETTGNYFIDTGQEGIIEKSAGKQYKAGKYMVNYYQRLFTAGIQDKENYLFFSEIDIPEYFPVENFIIIHRANKITGLTVYNDNLYIFTDAGVYKLSGYSIENFNLISVNEDIKNVINKTIIEYQNVLIYQSNNNVYMFDGVNSIDIGKNISPELIYNEDNFALIHKDKYILFIQNYALVYDLKLKYWVKYNWDMNYADKIENEILGAKNTNIYKLFENYSDNGNNITSIVKTKRFEIGDALTRKIFERLHLILGVRNSTITVRLRVDDNTIEEYVFDTNSADSGEKVLKKIRPVRGRGKYFEIELTEQSSENNFKFYGIETKYREIPAR